MLISNKTKDMMGKDCPTADCFLDLVLKRPSRIVKLVPYDKDNKMSMNRSRVQGSGADQRSAQPNKTVEEKKVVVKSAKVNRGNSAPPFLKTPSVEQDETRLAALVAKEQIPRARALHKRPTLLEIAYNRPKGRSQHVMQLWFLSRSCIKLDEKHKELEELRQSLDTQDSAVDWLEAEKQQLQQRLLEADEKLEKSVKVVASGADAGVAQPRAGGARGGRRPNRQHDETEHVWRELDETRRQVE
ncbi:Hypothetical predicted protein [Cloeon dipterum]|uniref:Uncharacterized protein n=1 Tax=Cloeon dipterum TaxID=197152 RepID=A0A8S1C6V4_9INSE|nr:Hypothetical predicted protein [Cloeon dipterum]